jgi:anti-anti-sigma factor
MSDDWRLTPLEISHERRDDTLIVFLAGELDVMSQGQLALAVESAGIDGGVQTVIVDMGALDFMDSTGLKDIANLRLTSEQRGVQVMVHGARPQVRRVFEITGLTEFLDD